MGPRYRLPSKLNTNHPLARGLQAFHLALPTRVNGFTWYDLAGSNNVTLSFATAGYGYVPSNRSGNLAAVKLNGTGTLLRSASVPVAGFPCTLACWVSPSVASATYGTIGLDSGTSANLIAMYQGSSKVGAYLNSGAGAILTTTTVPGNNQWYFATATFSQNVQNVYLNGGGKSTGSATATPASLANYRIGNDPFNNKVVGSMDCAMVYNRVLSDAEIMQLYLETKMGCPLLLRRVSSPKIFFPAGTAVVTPPVGVLKEFNQSVKSASFF